MPKFGKRSKRELATAHPDLQRLFNEVIKIYDCSVICGHRGKEDQDLAYRSGKSNAKWPKSNHNKTPALAVDCVSYPVDWSNVNEFYQLAGVVKAVAFQLGIKIKWGGDFKGAWDKPHFELVMK